MRAFRIELTQDDMKVLASDMALIKKLGTYTCKIEVTDDNGNNIKTTPTKICSTPKI